MFKRLKKNKGLKTFDILMKLENIGKLDAVMEEMTAKENLLFSAVNELIDTKPEWELFNSFIARTIEKGILTQEEVNAVLG